MATADAATPAHCVLRNVGPSYKGACGQMFGETPTLSLAPATALASGAWQAGRHPQSVLSGELGDDDNPHWPLELELHDGGNGVLRTEYGWLPVTHFDVSQTMQFDLDAACEVRPSALDEQIIRGAAEILSAQSRWNRSDNRRCPDAATVWSIYCAMQKATIEIAGTFHHRRPALEVVRKIVDDRAASRNYDHRLMDYNNDPTTKLDDVKTLFAEALAGMNDPAWLKKHGFLAE